MLTLEKVTQELRELLRDARKEYIFETGKILSAIKDYKIYEKKYKTFGEYINTELGISVRSAQTRMAIYSAFSPFPKDLIDELFSKMDMLHLYNIARLIKANRLITAEQVREFAQEWQGRSSREMSVEVSFMLGKRKETARETLKSLKEKIQILIEKNQMLTENLEACEKRERELEKKLRKTEKLLAQLREENKELKSKLRRLTKVFKEVA